MSLCPNVYRRGGLYWWRRRFVIPNGGRRAVAFSLKVRDPGIARIVGAKLNAEAGLLARQMELGMSTFEQGQAALEGLADMPFGLADDAFANFKPRPSAKSSVDEPTYSDEQERLMLLAMARESETRFRREARFNRAHFDPFEDASNAVACEQAIGLVYKYVAMRGSRARVDETDRAAMAALGLGPGIIGSIERDVISYARREHGANWDLGPDRVYFEKTLADAGVTLNEASILRLRKSYLNLCGDILLDATQRYAETSTPIHDALAVRRSDQNSRHQDAGPTETSEATPLVAPVEAPTAPRFPTAVALDSKAFTCSTIAMPTATPISFIDKVERLAEKKIKYKVSGRKDGWTEKTASQHVAIARLFAKSAGTDNALAMNQSHVGAYRDLLDELPKNYGKSSKDEFRSIDEIRARCEDLDQDEVGLEGGTINRHITQLGNCFRELRAHGIDIGTTAILARADDTPRERAAFSVADRTTLFGSKTWTGDEVVHGSQFFVPIIGNYECMRLGEIVGLATKDVDVDRMVIHVRPNKFRGLKSKESIRDLPIMSELERVEFCQYVEEASRLGYELLFQDLLRRGTATALANLYYKEWVKTLLEALPNARIENKSFHSWRKTGNTAMVGANINDPLRCQILGHAYKDVNGRHYTDVLPLDDKRAALSHIPITTSSVPRLPIQLSGDL